MRHFSGYQGAAYRSFALLITLKGRESCPFLVSHFHITEVRQASRQWNRELDGVILPITPKDRLQSVH